jgi:hypothetical protein
MWCFQQQAVLQRVSRVHRFQRGSFRTAHFWPTRVKSWRATSRRKFNRHCRACFVSHLS